MLMAVQGHYGASFGSFFGGCCNGVGCFNSRCLGGVLEGDLGVGYECKRVFRKRFNRVWVCVG